MFKKPSRCFFFLTPDEDSLICLSLEVVMMFKTLMRFYARPVASSMTEIRDLEEEGERHRVEIDVRVQRRRKTFEIGGRTPPPGSAAYGVYSARLALGELKSTTIETLRHLESNSGGSSWVVNKGGSGGSGPTQIAAVCRALGARRRSADFCADKTLQTAVSERQFYSSCHGIVL